MFFGFEIIAFVFASKKAFMALIFFESYQKISQKHYRVNLSSFSDSLTC